MPFTPKHAVLAYCRSGFELDLAAELRDRCGVLGVTGIPRAKPGSAFVELETHQPTDADRLWRELGWSEIAFARQWLRLVGRLDALPREDRAAPIATAVAQYVTAYRALLLEYPDTNAGKTMSRFCRRFRSALERALAAAGVNHAPAAPRLHVFFEHSTSARLALSQPANSAPWPLGIPRFKASRQAPSRSALKLEEALHTFLDTNQGAQCLRPGMSAVDLGAAPGGWSWVLAQRGLLVTGVDNAAIDPSLLAGGQVNAVRANGFRYRPKRPVDWLVCDMVERPRRVTDLVGAWLRRGDCRAAIYNLKLPMNRRWQTVSEAISQLQQTRGHNIVRCKQLYHDRDEVTLAVLPDIPG